MQKSKLQFKIQKWENAKKLKSYKFIPRERSDASGLEAQHGFTLIETLVAISILIVAIVGPLTIATKGLSSAVFARDQITAFYLAQEAVESIRNIRDENTIAGNNWLKGLDGSSGSPDCFASDGCTVDAPDNNKIEECTGECSVLRYNPTSGLYGYGIDGSWEDSIFTREVLLSAINADEVSITVALSWSTGLFNRTFNVRENIMNWQQ